MSDGKVYAYWDITLDCDCPSCGEYVNLLNYPDFWDGRDDFNIGEWKSDVDVTCPKCDHDFHVKTKN